MANRARISGKIDGLEDLFRAMKDLKAGARNRVTRKMVNAGSTPVLKAAKQKAPRRFGDLKKALGRKTVTYARKGVVVAVVGPRTDAKGKPAKFKRKVGTRTRGKSAGKDIYVNPANYAHLVEFGHAGPHPAPAHPFLRPAFDEQKATARARMIAVGRAGIEAEARKVARRVAVKQARAALGF